MSPQTVGCVALLSALSYWLKVVRRLMRALSVKSVIRLYVIVVGEEKGRQK